MSDAELLARLVRQRDEHAFEALLERYAPLVHAVGRQMLHDETAADDILQATFLVLWRNPGAIRQPDLLARWLYGTASRIARRSRQLSLKRRQREFMIAQEARASLLPDPGPDDSIRLLHDELQRLPDRLRDPILLCHFQGLTYEDAARRLHCPLGTFKSRLGKGRELLRSRPVRRGVGAALILAWLSRSTLAHESPNPVLLHSILESARQSSTGSLNSIPAQTSRRGSWTVPARTATIATVAGAAVGSLLNHRRRRWLRAAFALGSTVLAWSFLSFHGCAPSGSPLLRGPAFSPGSMVLVKQAAQPARPVLAEAEAHCHPARP